MRMQRRELARPIGNRPAGTRTGWSGLQPFAERLNPLHGEIFRNYPTEYCWSRLSPLPLRVETLTRHVEVFKSFRPKEGGPEDDLDWRQMRRGVADMCRRAEVSQKAYERYWDALGTVDDSTRFGEFTGIWSGLASSGDGASEPCALSRPAIVACCKRSIEGVSRSTG